jgi:hypothetical protein
MLAATILTIIAVVYICLCLIFYFFQDLFFFRPEKLPNYFNFNYAFPFEEIHLNMEDGGYVNGIYFKIPNSRGVVFYVKGNSRSIKGWGKFAKDFVGKGYDFFMVDFRGFGKSRGKRTEQNLYNDLQQAYKWLEEKYPEQDIILYGRSLGSGLATRIASWNNPKLLILDCPYYSFEYHINRYGFFMPINWLLRYKIRTDLYIKKVKCPIFILHGDKDRLIPFAQGVKLHELVENQSVLLPIIGAGHNNLPEFESYQDYLYDIMNDQDFFTNLKSKK